MLLASYTAIALGTFSGGWRIVRTMGARLTRLKPRSGFCAETGAAGAVLLATHLGLPVSTTHAIAGAIVGVGSINRLKAVRWGIATNIVGAWVLTIPMAATDRLADVLDAAPRRRSVRADRVRFRAATPNRAALRVQA